MARDDRGTRAAGPATAVGSRTSAAADATAVRAGSRLADRYRPIELIGHGHGVETYRGVDMDDGSDVVIKVVAAFRVPSAAQLRLEHEMEVLSLLDSPGIVPVTAWGRDDDLLYLVTPFVGGPNLADRLRDGPLPLSDALRVGRAMLGALDDAHTQGVIHRDVKPANVVMEDDPSGRVVLVDFGLARSHLLDAELRDVPVGTVRYMAPEQAGLIRVDVDERADLYSLGATLFEALAGRPLFDGATLGDVLRQQMTVQPPDLRSLGLGTPRALDEILQRLLRKDPAERYQAAAAARADLDDIVMALARGVAEPFVLVGARDRRHALVEPSFVGRDDELDALARLLASAGRGHPALVFIEGESGGGKTRLLTEFATRCGGEAWILRGQGLDQAAQRPYEILTGIVAEVCAAAATDEGLAARLRARLGEDAPAAGVAFPALAAALDIGSQRTGPEEHAEVRTLRVLAALLDGLGTPDRPAVVLLDDCQWADELSIKLIGQWQRRSEGGPSHVLLAAAYRSEEVGPGHAMRRLHATERLILPPLGPSDIRRIARSMAGALPDDVLDLVVRLADGSPFMASAVLRGLEETGALVAGSDGWRVDEDALADVRSSRRAAAVLSRRVRLLDAGTQRLLTVAAVLGKTFDVAMATELAGMDAAAARRSIELARRRHILWATGEDDRTAFAHDKLRETLLEMLDAEERRVLHERAGELLESRAPDRVFELAFHLDAAGRHARALPFALAAAEQARTQHALEAAEQQYRIASRGAAVRDAVTRCRVAEELGQVLMLRGRYDDATESFTWARHLAADATTAARIDGEIGELAFKRGDMAASSEALERAVRSLGQRLPRSVLTMLVCTVWELVVQCAHTLVPRLFVGRRSLDRAGTDLLAAHLYSRLAHTYWFQRGSVPCGFVHLRGMNLAERYPPTPELAQAYSEHAPVMTLLPWYGRGIAYAARSLAIRSGLDDLWGMGQSYHFTGVVLYAATRFEECLGRCHEAIRLLERTGDQWEVNTARWHVAYSLYRQGDLRAAVEVGRQVYLAGQEIGDPQARGIGLAVWSKASGGAVPEDLVAAELAAIGGDTHTAAEVMQAEAVRLLGQGRAAEAVEVLERADARVREAGLRQEYVAPVLPWLLTALRQARESLPDHASRRRQRLLRRSRRVARRAVLRSLGYRCNLPHTLREVALLHAARGRPRRARRAIERSIREASRQAAAAELAHSRVVRGQLGEEFGWHDAAADLSAGLEAEREVLAGLADLEPATEEMQASVSLVERFDSLLEAGRLVVASLDRFAVITSTRQAALSLLRADECVVVEVDDDGVLHAAAGGDTYSETAVRQAVETGRPVVIAVGAGEDVTDSVVLSDARSVMCVPVPVRGRVAWCIYVVHHDVGGLFGEEEQRLGGFISTLAGAALENAEGFAAVEELSRSLEGRVRERTAELEDANRRLDESLARLRAALGREREVSDQLRRLDELKTEFVAMVAHDLRTPMTVVAGFADTLRSLGDQLGAEQRQEMLERIAANMRRLSEFVENLLSFARIETGELRYELHPLDIDALVRRTVSELETAESERSFRVLVESPLPTVVADEERIWQVVTNLLSNAVKFSPATEPVEVRVRSVERAVEITVRDHGCGIPEAEVPKLFQKFSQLDFGGEKRPMGTGLGLYIARSIVEAHGGTIAVDPVDPADGAGTRFRVTLPVCGPPET